MGLTYSIQIVKSLGLAIGNVRWFSWTPQWIKRGQVACEATIFSGEVACEATIFSKMMSGPANAYVIIIMVTEAGQLQPPYLLVSNDHDTQHEYPSTVVNLICYLLTWYTSDIILCMGSANERQCYIVTSSLIGCAFTQNDSCTYGIADTVFHWGWEVDWALWEVGKCWFALCIYNDNNSLICGLDVRSENTCNPISYIQVTGTAYIIV